MPGIRLNQEIFISRANKKHGNLYDYSLVIFEKTTKPVIIICSEHGKFEQLPSNHLVGKGCPKCSHSYKLTKTTFIVKARKIHGNKYNYSLVKYINWKTKVIIVCKTHGQFKQIPTSHLQGSGCPSCCTKFVKAPLTTAGFIKKAKIIHGNKYDYSLTVYKRANINVTIICKKHGKFKQTPNNHLSGKGCSSCWLHNSKKEIAWLDSLKIPASCRNKLICHNKKKIYC